MKSSLLILICILNTGYFLAQNFQWVKGMGGNHIDEGNSIAVDKKGNVYTVGTLIVNSGIEDYDPGPLIYDIGTSYSSGSALFISKLDSSGNFIWAKSIYGIGSFYGIDMCMDLLDNIYITGHYYGSIDFDPDPLTDYIVNDLTAYHAFVLKLDSNGLFQWAKTFGSNATGTLNYAFGKSITSDLNQNVFVAGEFLGQIAFDPGAPNNYITSNGGKDCFLIKLDPLGNFNWVRTFGSNTDDDLTAVACDAVGKPIIVGTYKTIMDCDPGVGIYNIMSVGSGVDNYIIKLTSSGSFEWANSIGGSSDADYFFSVTTDQNSNIYSCGRSADPCIYKHDSLGNLIWNKGLIGCCTMRDIDVDQHGNVNIAGNVFCTTDLDPGPGIYNLSPNDEDIFILQLDSIGNFKWVKQAGGGLADGATSTAHDKYQNIYTTGFYTNYADFDIGGATYPITSNGWRDVFVLKYSTQNILVTNMKTDYRNEELLVTVYPNPNNGSFVIKSKDNLELSIINELGEILQTRNLNQKNYYTENISGLQSGIYFLIANGKNQNISQKIIVAK